MIALSKPSLRSSARKNVGLEPLATGMEVPRTRSTKRTRDSSVSNESNGSSKKAKSETRKISSEKALLQKENARVLPIRDLHFKQNAVTQTGRKRKAESPQQILNNPTISPIHHTEAPNQAGTQTLNPPKQVEKRSLRSGDGGSRSKSELALYIPNYDDFVSLEPKQPEVIDKDTLLHITDESTNSTNASTKSSRTSLSPSKGKIHSAYRFSLEQAFSGTIEWPEETFTILNNAEKIDSPSVTVRHPIKDPLDDSIYLKAHRREERQEKQLRNIEKERAMHEKVQLERLLDGLRGHDWLRTMGISGVTETEKKLFEPNRSSCIGYVRILLDKFKLWKEEEKRRKVERETAEDEEDDDDDEDGGDDTEDGEQTEAGAQFDPESDGDPPNDRDVDASAARQLHQEAKLATNARKHRSKSHPQQSSALPQAVPIKSFFSKPYLREATIGKHRRGRSRYAFGQPLIEPQDKAFELPESILTSDALISVSRRSSKNKRDMG